MRERMVFDMSNVSNDVKAYWRCLFRAGYTDISIRELSTGVFYLTCLDSDRNKIREILTKDDVRNCPLF